MKRILINASMITEMPTGVGVHNVEILKHLLPKLRESSLDYVVYCYDPKQIEGFTGKNTVRKISLGPVMDKILLRFLSVHRLLWNFFLLNNLASDFNIIYSLSTYGALRNGKQIITVHDLISLRFPKQHKFQYLYFKYFVPVILENCAKVISISNFTAKEIQTFYPQIRPVKIDVVKNGVDHLSDKSNLISDDLVDTIAQSKPFCLAVGASYYHKNIQTLLEAADLLICDNIKFLILGKPSKYYQKLKKKAKDQKLNNVCFIDYADSATLSSLYKKATLHIYITLYEGFGFPPAEAAFYGTPSIISDHAALMEIYDSCFPVVNPIDAGEIADQIKLNFISNPEHNHAVFSHLKTAYNWEKSALEIFCLLKVHLKLC